MTDINTLITKFLTAKRHSRQERVAAYELAGLAVKLYQENTRLRNILADRLSHLYYAFQGAISEESRLDG